MKFIALSFDDARSDTYEVAMTIMKKYGLTGIVNAIASKNYEDKAAEALKHFGIFDYFVSMMI